MSATVDVYVGGKADIVLQCANRGRTSLAAFGPDDHITAYVYRGGTEGILFNPTAVWYVGNPPGIQTGYLEGQVLATISSTQAAMLETNGNYELQVWWSAANDATNSSPIATVRLNVKPAFGTAAQTIATYCTLKDMLRYAPWIKIVQDQDIDVEGFYDQRLEARYWMDWMCVNCYRGSFVGLFETHSTAAFAFGYAGWRRSLGPSTSLLDYLERNMLIVRPQIVRACAYKAISTVGLAQIGTNSQFTSLGAYFRDMATREAVATTAEIDTNGDGIGELFINLGTTNTLAS